MYNECNCTPCKYINENLLELHEMLWEGMLWEGIVFFSSEQNMKQTKCYKSLTCMSRYFFKLLFNTVVQDDDTAWQRNRTYTKSSDGDTTWQRNRTYTKSSGTESGRSSIQKQSEDNHTFKTNNIVLKQTTSA